MQYTRFDQPVTVLVGMGYPVRIETVMEAYSLLQDWPSTNRNTCHAVALNACRAGLVGDIDPETVRATLVEFAHRNDILVPDAAASLAPTSRAAGAEGTVGKKYPH